MLPGFLWITCALVICHAEATYGRGCPAFWTRVGNHCYRLISSMGVDTLGFPTIYHARVACMEHGGDLAHIDRIEDENEIFVIMRRMSLDSVPRKMYIGLIDMNATRDFTWFSGDSPHYTDWAFGEPGNSDEHCVVIKSPYRTWRSPEETEWHDYPCCVQTNIKHSLCHRDVDVYDEDLPNAINPTFEQLCNTVDECNSNPCQHNGTCLDHVMGYTCTCLYGYQGSHCQEEVLCPVPDLDHAHLGDIGENVINASSSYDLHSVVSVTCEQGHGFSERIVPPTRRYNCTEHGWEELVEAEIQCPHVPSWSGLIANATSRYYGDTVDYTCDKGMEFEDGEEMKTSKCNVTGHWDPSLTECLEKVPLSKSIREKKPVEATGAAVFGVFGMAFLIAELVIFVLMDLNVLRLHLIIGFMNIKSIFSAVRDRHKTENGFSPVPVHL